MRTAVGALLAALVALALLPLAPPVVARTETELEEVRGLWVLRSSLSSPQSVASLIRTASASGFNTLFVQVRGRGDAYYRGGIEPRAVELSTPARSFDPLRDVIAAAHAAGLRVHAWVNVNLVSSAADLPDGARARRLPAP